MDTGTVFANLFTGFCVFWSFVAIYLVSGFNQQRAQKQKSVESPMTGQEVEEVIIREGMIEAALGASLLFRLHHGSLAAQSRLRRRPRPHILHVVPSAEDQGSSVVGIRSLSDQQHGLQRYIEEST